MPISEPLSAWQRHPVFMYASCLEGRLHLAYVGEPLPACFTGAVMPLEHFDLRPVSLQKARLTRLSAFLQAGKAESPLPSKHRCRSVDLATQGAGSWKY